MKHYFDESESENWTPEALAVSNEICRALRPIIEKAAAEGYSLRDLQYIIEASALDLTVEALIDKANPITTSPLQKSQ